MSNAQTATEIADAMSHFVDVSEVLVRERIEKLKAFREKHIFDADARRDRITSTIDELIADAENDLARLGDGEAPIAIDAAGNPSRQPGDDR